MYDLEKLEALRATIDQNNIWLQDAIQEAARIERELAQFICELDERDQAAERATIQS